MLFARTHLSLFFAILLAVLALAREFFEIYHLNLFLSEFKNIWNIFIFTISLLTVLAVIWEVFGNKLTVSLQERRYIAATERLVQEFSKYQRKLEYAENPSDCETLLKDFFMSLFKIASWVLCGNVAVDVYLMIFDSNTNSLVLDKSNYFQAEKTKNIEIPFESVILPLGRIDSHLISPAQAVFENKVLIAHMPKKSNKIFFLFDRDNLGKFTIASMSEGWYPTNSLLENFQSLLAVPVSNHDDENTIEMFGVLNFTTKNRDLFIPRDYVMSKTFANLIAEAIVANRRKLFEIEVGYSNN